MADHFQVVSNAPGFFSRLSESIKGIFIGILFFVLAFPLLWWGEHRKNEAEFVDEAKAVISESAPTVEDKTLVKTTGVIATEEVINDDDYLTNDSKPHYMLLSRESEMYAWKENKKTEKKGDKEVTTYDYAKEWTSSPDESSKFYEPNGHTNPQMAESSRSFQAEDATIGALPFDAGKVSFYGTKDLAVTEAMVQKTEDNPLFVAAGKIYIPSDTYSSRNPAQTPKVGDVRLQYTYFPAGVEGAIVGNWESGKIVSHIYNGDSTFFGAYAGTLDEFRAELNSQYRMMLWIIRLGALFMLWIGMNLILGPMLMLLDSIPILGSVGRVAVSIATFGIAFVLWTLTIVLANLWLVLLATAAIGIGVMVYVKGKQKTQTAAAAPMAKVA